MIEIKNNSIIIRDKKLIEELKSSEYGETREEKLVLSLIEGLYLLNKNKIELNRSKRDLLEYSCSKINNFELKYLVYSDLRERGLFLKSGGKNADFYLYDRGDKPSKDPFSTLIYVLTEREPIKINEVLKKTMKANRLRKNIILAMVDGEGDITYYETKKFSPNGNVSNEYNIKAEAKLLDDKVIAINRGEELYLDSFFGKPFLENIYQLTILEASYLSRKNVIDLSLEEIRGKGQEIDSDFELKDKVYTDLREKGLVPKTGFKFGTHFRVYKDYNGPDELGHAEYLIQALKPSAELNPPDVSGAVRLAQNVRKKILFAVVRDKIDYLELDRVKI